jgi:hypothetical protein
MTTEVYVVIFTDSVGQHMGTAVFAALPSADQMKAVWVEKYGETEAEFRIEEVNLRRAHYWTVSIRDEDGEEADISTTIWREAVR